MYQGIRAAAFQASIVFQDGLPCGGDVIGPKPKWSVTIFIIVLKPHPRMAPSSRALRQEDKPLNLFYCLVRVALNGQKGDLLLSRT